MSEAPRDFIDLFRYLNEYRVEYLIVGGYALVYYGYPLSPDDLDLFVSPNKDNLNRLLQTLDSFGFSDLALTPQDFADPDKLVSLGFPPEQLDIISSISGVSWVDAWKSRITGSFGETPVYIISKDLLIKNKRSRGRKQDQKDADLLEQLDIDGLTERLPFSEPTIP